MFEKHPSYYYSTRRRGSVIFREDLLDDPDELWLLWQDIVVFFSPFYTEMWEGSSSFISFFCPTYYSRATIFDIWSPSQLIGCVCTAKSISAVVLKPRKLSLINNPPVSPWTIQLFPYSGKMCKVMNRLSTQSAAPCFLLWKEEKIDKW